MPRSVCVRTVCCSHLRFSWQVLMVLTLLCVVLQLLGVVWQARNTKVTGPADEKSDSRQKDGGDPLSSPTTSDPQQREYDLFQWRVDKNLDTTPARRLASTINRNFVVNGHQPARKPDQRDPQLEHWGYPEVKESLAQKQKLDNMAEMPPEVPLKDEPFVQQERVKESSAQIQKLDNMARTPPEDVHQEQVKQLTAQNENMDTMSRMIPDLPPSPPKEPQQSSHYETHSNNQDINTISQDTSGTCRPKNHIVFLKTHKTASSTILNILYRYGDTRNLTFALPAKMYSQLYYPYFFMSYFVEGLKLRRFKEFHILCNHMRFQALEVRKVMSVDTFYFSILRNPVSMMESIFMYYKSIPAFRSFRTLADFLLDGGRSFNASQPNNHYARNLLTFDFGMDSSPPASQEELDQRSLTMIAAVESNFHLILISEYFDESMILLRHSLCWTLEDVVSFRLNSRNEKSRNKLSPALDNLVKQWNSLDWRLYQHFNATFWHRIDTLLGREKLQEEVELLRARRAELEQTCLLGGGAVDPDKIKDSSFKPFQYGAAVIQGYNIRPGLDNETHNLCQRLIKPELQYTNALYAKQFPDLAAKQRAAQAAKQVVRRIITTTRHSANVKDSALKYNVQMRTVQNNSSKTNVHLHTQTLAKPNKDVKSYANNAFAVVQQSVKVPSDKHDKLVHTPT